MPDDSVALDLYRLHRTALISYARGIVGDRDSAEDVVQDAWLQLKQALDRGVLRDPLPYLYRIVRNLAIDARRRAQRRLRHIADQGEEHIAMVADDGPSPEQVVRAQVELACVERALASLPERQRIAIEMVRLGGFRLRDVAERLHISVSLAHLLVVQGLAECHRQCRPDPSPGRTGFEKAR